MSEVATLNLRQDLVDYFDKAIQDFTACADYQRLVAGQCSASEVRQFIRNLFIPHYQSTHIVAFGYALLPSAASELIKENLLEELGAKEGEEAHPKLLIKLAEGAGFSETEIEALIAESERQSREFCAQQLPFPTLRDMGLAMLLESSSFEHLLSRHSGQIGLALKTFYHLPDSCLVWFELHGELDIRHAEESLTVIGEYAKFHDIERQHLERIAGLVFAANPFLKRYFPDALGSKRRTTSRAVVESITVYRLDIPFREAFRHAQAERLASDAIVVQVHGSDGSVGYGEALPRSYVTGETWSSVSAFLREAAPRVFAQEFAEPDAVWNELAAYGLENIYGGKVAPTSELNNAAFCALELALLDWSYRRAGKSLADRLPPRRTEVVYSGIVPAEDPEAAANLARRYIDAGLQQLKLKVGVGDDAGRLAAVRRSVGDEARIRVDANGAWEIEEAVDALLRLKPFGIDCVEQPISHQRQDHVAALKLVREKTGIPVIADESLNTLADAQALAAAKACDYFNVRVSKNGGLTGALAIAHIAAQAGIGVLVGAQVGETAILTAAGRCLAAHLPSLSYAEGSFGTLLLSEDIALQELRFGPGGVAPVLTGPGLGIEVQQETLERLAVETIVLRHAG